MVIVKVGIGCSDVGPFSFTKCLERIPVKTCLGSSPVRVEGLESTTVVLFSLVACGKE